MWHGLPPKPLSTFVNITIWRSTRCLKCVTAWTSTGRVTNPQDHPRFQAVFVGRTPSVTALALRDVVVAVCAAEMEDISTTSSRATQLLLFVYYAR